MLGASKASPHRLRPRRSLHESQTKQQLKPNKSKCTVTIKIIKLASAILVPLMIGVFTFVTALQESRTSQMQRDADFTRSERAAQLQREAENRQREYQEETAKEMQRQNIYDAFMKDMKSIVLKDNLDLTTAEVLFARAKTVSTLEQIDNKRKWYLIKFLYDNQLLNYKKETTNKYIDLMGADLSNVQFGSKIKYVRRIDLTSIRLLQLELKNTSFENVILNRASFTSSNLNNSNFIDVSMIGTDFSDTTLENSQFSLSHFQNISFKGATLKRSLLSPVLTVGQLFLDKIDYTNSDLSESKFQNIKITLTVKFDGANLGQIQFFDTEFPKGILFKNFNMQMSKFVSIRLDNGAFISCNMTGTVFEKPSFQSITFEEVDLRNSQFNNITDSTGIIHLNKVNLIGSNLNVSRKQVFRISDSLLPNGTFETSFDRFQVNMIQNGNAEQGLCYYSLSQNRTGEQLSGWLVTGNVMQTYYNTSEQQMSISNYQSDWQSCFFFGGYANTNETKSAGHRIQQEINVEQLTVLINLRQIGYNVSAYMGGFDDDDSSTSMKIIFKSGIKVINQLTLSK
ncbi:unnamed protein product [Adineta steineri]|uniref:Pentapeptide repeat-containing protein n=1 Tax=Adineta steineri TaxID=433720 RepID=A0A814A7L6_9BILA|nr:unnamed protein product [Adineta steineri]CAF0910714.1 unnamed protein product [Adineta steineri]